MDVRLLAPRDLHRLMPLLRKYSFNPYRNYRAFSERTQADVLLAEAEAVLSQADAFAFVAGEDEQTVSSAVVARRLAWDSDFFALPIGRIERILGNDHAACRAALSFALVQLRKLGLRHLTARADVADLATAALLEDHGFRLVGNLSSYVARPNLEPPNVVRSRGAVRLMRVEDAPTVVAIAREAFQNVRSRFHVDERFPQDRANALYPEWARRCANREMADTVLVSESERRGLLGFIAFRRVEPVSTVVGLPVFGGGLGACRPEAPGAYLGLMRATVLWGHERGGIVEAQTPGDNFAAVAVFEKVGLRLRRAEYVFHLWLD
jgi:L-amino acid N-acyltransferase YncA